MYEGHIDRLHDEVRWLPCSPACANWLRYGVQPKTLVLAWCRAVLLDRRTTGRTSASVAAASWSRGSGRERP